ncbi:MAG: hypothetical protein KBC57_00070 [Neisseriaceae bacterium]|nr:hypothetical protein [Neisseriaceae bacterium]MBP6860734.1 hypothetical protein [Neisseriaceae bacterium]
MMNLWLSRWAMLALGLYSTAAQALYVSDDVFVVESDKPYLSRQFYNDSQTSNIYLISMYQIDRPGLSETARPIPNGEVMYSPLSMMVNAGQFEYFKIFYRGPNDDQERYYRMVIREVPPNAVKDGEVIKDSMVSAIVALDTYAVIRPRQLRLKHEYHPEAGTLVNTGNTFLRVLLNKGCNAETEDEAVVVDLLPGEVLRHERLRGQHRKFIVTNSQYLKLGEQCFDQQATSAE